MWMVLFSNIPRGEWGSRNVGDIGQKGTSSRTGEGVCLPGSPSPSCLSSGRFSAQQGLYFLCLVWTKTDYESCTAKHTAADFHVCSRPSLYIWNLSLCFLLSCSNIIFQRIIMYIIHYRIKAWHFEVRPSTLPTYFRSKLFSVLLYFVRQVEVFEYVPACSRRLLREVCGEKKNIQWRTLLWLGWSCN